MTEYPVGGSGTAEAALQELAQGGDEQAALGALASADVLLPEVAPPAEQDGDPNMVRLPVAEQPDGTQLVPAFTSEAKLKNALPTISRFRLIRMATLGRLWPQGTNLVLAIDPGTDIGITLPEEGVRAMAALGG